MKYCFYAFMIHQSTTSRYSKSSFIIRNIRIYSRLTKLVRVELHDEIHFQQILTLKSRLFITKKIIVMNRREHVIEKRISKIFLYKKKQINDLGNQFLFYTKINENHYQAF